MYSLQTVTSAQYVDAAHQAAATAGVSHLTALFANDERPIRGCFAIYALYLSPTGIQGFRLPLAEGDPAFPSLTPLLPAAAWYEREIHDLFGLIPLGHPDLRPLVLHENWPSDAFPLRKDFKNLPAPGTFRPFPMTHVQGEGVFEVPVGPIHAGIIEPGHFRFSQAGEAILHLDARLFFTHRGIEKSVESLPLAAALFRVERTCGACTVSHALSYCQAVENLCNAAVPRRGQLLRIVAAELERLYNHVGDTGNLCAGLGFAVGTSHGGRMKERLMRLNESCAGSRFLRGWIIPGGVAFDLDPLLRHEISDHLRTLEEDIYELNTILQENPAFLDRVCTTGIVPHQAALDLALVGVAARASGIDRDLRRDHPYSGYELLSFAVPVEKSGDVAARLWIRIQEIFQSVHILRQTLRLLESADTPLATTLGPAPPYSTAIGWSESPRGANLHWVMSGKDNTLYRCFLRSASYPNWPALSVAAPGNIIPDFPLINKSFELCYACLDR